MATDVPDEARVYMADETAKPLDSIPCASQAEYVPVVNATLATGLSAAQLQERKAEQQRLLDLHVKATDDLSAHNDKWGFGYASGGYAPPPKILTDAVAASLKAYRASLNNFTEEEVHPEEVRVVLDADLGRIKVCATLTNATESCGEMHVSLPAVDGWRLIFAEDQVGDYPQKVVCQLNAQAEQTYKVANEAANTGAGISQHTREIHARAFKIPAGDTAVVTFHLQLHNEQTFWKPMPLPVGAGRGGDAKEAIEYTIFTPPSANSGTRFRYDVRPTKRTDHAFTLPTSQAVEAEAATRGCAVYYLQTERCRNHNTTLHNAVNLMAASVGFVAPPTHLALKVRLERPQNDGFEIIDHAMLGLHLEPDEAHVALLHHVPAHHTDVEGSLPGDAVAVVRVTMPSTMPTSGAAVRDPLAEPIRVFIIGDGSGSMLATAPSGSGATNLQKLGAEFGALGTKLLGLLPYLREHGLSVLGDRVQVTFVRFHSFARVVAKDVELTGPNAQQQMAAAIEAFRNCNDIGGTCYSSWLEVLEEQAKRPGPIVALLGTDGAAHDGREFFPRLDALKRQRPDMKLVVLAMGAYLDEPCASKVQTDGHRLMEEVGGCVPDQGYRLLFSCIASTMAHLTLTVGAPILSLSGGRGVMPRRVGAGDAVRASLDLTPGQSVVLTVPARYDAEEIGSEHLVLPKFFLGAVECECLSGHNRAWMVPPRRSGGSSPNPGAVLGNLDPMYCSTELRFVADEADRRRRCIERIGLATETDTTYTKRVALYDYPGDKGVLDAGVKATPLKCVMREGVLASAQAATHGWMTNPATRPPLVEVVPTYAPPDENEPVYRSLGAEDAEPAAYTSLGSDVAPARSAPSAKEDVVLNALPTARDLVNAARNHGYEAAHNQGGVLSQLLPRLRVIEGRLGAIVASQARGGLSRSADPLDRLTLAMHRTYDDMADEQGGVDDSFLPATNAELRAVAGVLVHQAFATQFEGGVDVHDQALADDAAALLLRTKYLRALAERMAGSDPLGRLLYRATLTFSNFVENARPGPPAQSSVDLGLSFDLVTTRRKDASASMPSDVAVGKSAGHAARCAISVLVEAWSNVGGMSAGTFPGNGLVRMRENPEGFARQTFHLPHYAGNEHVRGPAACDASVKCEHQSFFDALDEALGVQVDAALGLARQAP
jgi:hypothetical protein